MRALILGEVDRASFARFSDVLAILQTFIAGLRCEALTASFVIDATIDRRIFETYVESVETTSPPQATDSHESPTL